MRRLMEKNTVHTEELLGLIPEPSEENIARVDEAIAFLNINLILKSIFE